MQVPLVAGGALLPIRKISEEALMGLLQKVANLKVQQELEKAERDAENTKKKAEDKVAKAAAPDAKANGKVQPLASPRKVAEPSGQAREAAFIDQLRQLCEWCRATLRLSSSVADGIMLLGLHGALATKVELSVDGKAKVVKGWSSLRRQIKKFAYKLADVTIAPDDEDLNRDSEPDVDDGASTTATWKSIDNAMCSKFDEAQGFAFLSDTHHKKLVTDACSILLHNHPSQNIICHLEGTRTMLYYNIRYYAIL